MGIYLDPKELLCGVCVSVFAWVSIIVTAGAIKICTEQNL